MDYVVVFLIIISVILIYFSAKCVFVIALVAETIAFSLFSDLLWKHTSLVFYKLNRLRPTRIEPVWYSCTFFGWYARFILFDKMVLYG